MASQTLAAKQILGVVVSAGKMMKTVKVRMVKQHWNRKIRKNYNVPYNMLVNDPNSSLIAGDVIYMTPEVHSKHVKHTVSSILAPFEKPIDQRPPLLTQEEREAIYNEKRSAKLERRKEREIEAARIKSEEKLSKKKGVAVKQIDDGGAGGGKGPDGKGREVLPQGLHKFGSINEEARQGKRRALEQEQKSAVNEKDRRKVAQRKDEELQKEALKR